jgi:FAD/FMN-containing dehydrogenase
LRIAPQGTGHNATPIAWDQGTILLSTSRMRGVKIDVTARRARVAAGALWLEVTEPASEHGLAPLAGSSPDVGVVGYCLGGGVSWLGRRHGLAANSVLAIEIVTADGRLRRVDAEHDAALFWALRGGGGSFGVVTGLEFRLHPVASVYAGTSYFDVERAAETLGVYRDWVAGAPDELSTAVLITRLPDSGRRALALRVTHVGEASEAERLIAPLRAAAGPALVEGFRSAPFGDVPIGGTPPRHLDLLEDLPDPALDFLVEAASDDGLGISTIEIRHWGGEMSRPSSAAGPVSDRRARFSVIADSTSPALAATLRSHALGRSFLNFLGDTSRTADAYTAGDWQRLREVKAAYDPYGVFSRNHVIG